MTILSLFRYVQAVFMFILIKQGMTKEEAFKALEGIRRAELHD